MSKYKLIALDLDGTLNNSNKEITQETKNALMKIQENGIKLVLATGRPTPGLRREAKELNFEKYNGYLLSYNGARIDEYLSKNIFNQTLTIKEVQAVYDRFKKGYKLSIMSYQDTNLIAEDGYGVRIHSEAQLNGMGVKLVDNLKDYIDFEPSKILFAADNDEYIATIEEEFKEPFKDSLSIYRSAPFYLEVMAKNVDKAKSLDFLAQKLGFTSNEIIAFGDGFNDLSMLEYAGVGIAMGNADDEVKAKANIITADNDSDGIAKALYKLFPDIFIDYQ